MRCIRAMHLALALGCFLWLATFPALSQTQDERVQIIMSKLPPPTSATYRAMRKRAGRADVQVLTLTKTEMWSVPTDRVAAVKGAAARLGVGVNELAADWNHVFRPMPAHTSMSGEQKAMVGRTMASKRRHWGQHDAAASCCNGRVRANQGRNSAGDFQGAGEDHSQTQREDCSHDHPHERRHKIRHVHLARHG